MPWGDVVSRVECWLHNPHPYTITVAVLSTEDAELFDPALEICTSIWDWSCTTGHWDPAYTLSSSENITVEWIVYAEARASVAPAGEAIVEFGLKITNYGTNRTACPECTVRFVNTTLQLGEWWRVDWDGGGASLGPGDVCAIPPEQTVSLAPAMSGEASMFRVTNTDDAAGPTRGFHDLPAVLRQGRD